MAVGDVITAARYNNLQSRLATIYGNGTGNSGYGQVVTSSPVAGNSTKLVEASDMNNLFVDMNACRQHQANESVNAEIAQIVIGDTIGENESEDTTGDSGSGVKKGITDYESLMQTIEDDKLLIDATQSSLDPGITSVRNSNWNGVITHTVVATFASADRRRHFFNSGGEIRFSAVLSGGSGAKQEDWRTMLSNMGTIKFNYTQTSSTGSGTESSIGNYELTETSQQIFRKAGSGVYAENDYFIYANEVPLTQADIDAGYTGPYKIKFTIEFRDDDTGDQQGIGAPEDEDVQPTLTSTVQTFRASGDFVDVPAPAYNNETTL